MRYGGVEVASESGINSVGKLTDSDAEKIQRIVQKLLKGALYWHEWWDLEAELSMLSNEEATRAALATIVAFTDASSSSWVPWEFLLGMMEFERWLDPGWAKQFRWRLNYLSTLRLDSLPPRLAAVLQFAPQIRRWTVARCSGRIETVLEDAQTFVDAPGGLGHHALAVLGLHVLKNNDPDKAIDFYLRGIAKEPDDVLCYFGYFGDFEHEILRWFDLNDEEVALGRSLRNVVSQASWISPVNHR